MSYTITRNGQTMNKDGITVESLFCRSKQFAWVQPDEWQGGGYALFEGDEFDKRYFGLDTLRIETSQEIIPTLAVKITVTGRKVIRWDVKDRPGYRCRIEFCGDGEPSTFTSGVVYLNK